MLRRKDSAYLMIIERSFLPFLHKNLCSGCSLELPRHSQVHNIGMKKKAKLFLDYHQIRTLSVLLGIVLYQQPATKICDLLHKSLSLQDSNMKSE